MTRQPSLAGSG